MLQHTNMLPFSQTIEAIHYALFLKGYTWACLQVFLERIYTRQNKFLLCYFKMFVTIDVKLLKIWGEIRDLWEG
jgi:hypothetical protein